jgi:hypothetical protein
MNSVASVVIAGVVALLTFDTVGALASRRFGFAYPRLMIGSFFIYTLVGFAAAPSGSLVLAGFAGAVVALFEATLGWAISYATDGKGGLADGGPGHPQCR